MEDNETPTKGKEKWYPGKFIGKAIKRSSTTPEETGTASDSSRSNSKAVNAIPPEVFTRNSENFDQISHDQSHSEEFSETIPEINNNSQKFTVCLKINEVKYINIQSPRVLLEVDGVGSTFPYSESIGIIEKEFDIQNITSDFKIEFRGAQASGIILIPLVNFLTATGNFKPPQAAWYELYPYYDQSLILKAESNNPSKFRSGFSDSPGTALNKPVNSLGFLNLEISIKSPIPGIKLFFLPNTNKIQSKGIKTSEVDIELSESSLMLYNSKINRDLDRLKTILTLPTCISLVSSFPEVFILVGLSSFIIYSTSLHQLPFLMFITVLLNGILTLNNRKINPLVWNDPGVTNMTSTNSQVSVNYAVNSLLNNPNNNANALLANLFKTNMTLNSQLNSLVVNFEKFINLLSFADPRISLVFYAAYFILTLLATIWISIFSVSSFIFIFFSCFLLIVASLEVVEEQISNLPKISAFLPVIRKLKVFFYYLEIFWSKIPDNLELNHR